MKDIDGLPAYQYEIGQDPIDVAIGIAETQLFCRDQVLAGRAESPAAFPAYGSDEAGAIARRIVGDLMGAGWKPPTAEEIKAALDGDDEPPALEAS